jgi:hypothetical protein
MAKRVKIKWYMASNEILLRHFLNTTEYDIPLPVFVGFLSLPCQLILAIIDCDQLGKDRMEIACACLQEGTGIHYEHYFHGNSLDETRRRTALW